jgi:alpha/beta superfamily hydrolase
MLHPHPLYGGSMQNNVVDAVILAAGRCGLATLRFNFRGVGESHGQFNGGVGEADDVGAALSFLAQESGTDKFILAGYSFGAAVALSYCHGTDHRVKHLYLIAPPPDLLGESRSLEISETRKIILGENDLLASPADVSALLSDHGQRSLVEVIPQTDHFFTGKAAALIQMLEELFTHDM